MKTKLFVIILLICAMLVSCDTPGPLETKSPEEGQPAIATDTPIPPTDTPVPPTDTPTPIPSLEDVIKAAGFDSIEALIPVGFNLGGMLTIEESQSYSKNDGSEFVHVVVFPLPTDVEKTGFALELAQPNIILEAIVMALQGIGIEAKTDLSGAQIGDASKGVTFISNIAGANARLDVVLLQRGDRGAIVVVGRPDGNQPSINAFDVAQKLDEKLQ